MKFLKKPIFVGFMPNLLFQDVAIAMSFVLPWKWKKLKIGTAVSELEQNLQNLFGVSSATTFDSGRSSLQIALEVLGVKSGDEVLVQAYTCCVVSNAIIWTGATPIYVDITDQFNMDAADLEKKITSKSKVLIIQHTFGIPANLSALMKIAQKYNLKVIEDCAHVMGSLYNGKMLGTYGDIGMLSFGTEKPISAGRGGALITSNKTLATAIQEAQKRLPPTSTAQILQQLLTFKLFFVSKPLYNIFIGKILLAIFKKTKLLSRIIEPSEKRGQTAPHYPTQFPNSLAEIALHQLKHLQTFNDHRRETSRTYLAQIQNPQIIISEGLSGLPLLRLPLRVKNPRKLHQMAQKEGILLGDWYNTVIAPKDADIFQMKYTAGSCPKAEQLASESINLPTSIHIKKQDQKRILSILNAYVD